MKRTMLSVVLLLPLVVSLCAHAGDQVPEPVIRSERVLLLPPLMQRALVAHSPEFMAWAEHDFLPSIIRDYPFSEGQTPSALIRDFNGDNRRDVILSGHDTTHNVLLAILSTGDSVRVVEIDTAPLTNPETETYDQERGLWQYLLLQPSGEIQIPDGLTLRLRNNAFQRIDHQKASSLFVLEGDRFQEYVVGD